MNELPRRVNPEKLGRRNAKLSGTLALVELTRINDICKQAAGTMATVELDFSLVGKQCEIQGLASCQLQLICQRCLEVMPYAININFMLKAGNTAEQDEVVLLHSDGTLQVYDMLEDEIILAIPYYPKHDGYDCNLTGADNGSTKE